MPEMGCFTLKLGRNLERPLSEGPTYWSAGFGVGDGYTGPLLTEAHGRRDVAEVEGPGVWLKVPESLAGHGAPSSGTQKGPWGHGHVGEPERQVQPPRERAE